MRGLPAPRDQHPPLVPAGLYWVEAVPPGACERGAAAASSIAPMASRDECVNLCAIAQVKLVGATAHYATADLDEGPIIEQDCARISHKNSIDDLLRKGRVLEKNVLVTAVRAHVEDRIIVYESKCVVFGE